MPKRFCPKFCPVPWGSSAELVCLGQGQCWGRGDFSTLHLTALHCTALHYTSLHCTALHRAALGYMELSPQLAPGSHLPLLFLFPTTALLCTVLYCPVLYFTVLYCTVLYSTVLYCTGLYCTVLYWTALSTIKAYNGYQPCHKELWINPAANRTFSVITLETAGIRIVNPDVGRLGL